MSDYERKRLREHINVLEIEKTNKTDRIKRIKDAREIDYLWYRIREIDTEIKYIKKAFVIMVGENV